MATMAKVQSRNQITLPREVRRASGIHAGDSVLIRSTGPGTVELKVVPHMTFEESLERFRVNESVDMDQLQRDIGEDIVADVLRTLTDE